MGLDMYLYEEKYISPTWGQNGPQDADPSIPNQIRELAGLQAGDPEDGALGSSLNVQATVMYWRKANAIHQWFVTNVQGGEDDCRPHHLGAGQLEELIAVIEKILAAPEAGGVRDAKAMELLPPTSGFFFGGVELDEWYYKDLQRTRRALKRVLANAAKDWPVFVYQSSW